MDENWVAAVDAVEDGAIRATLSRRARGTPVQGMFTRLQVEDQTWLCRVQSVSMTNPIHANEQFAPIIMQNGHVPEWSGYTDIEKAEVEVISIVDRDGRHMPRQVNPASGSRLVELEKDDMKQFLRDSEYLVTVGTIANSNDVPAPVINRHFGPMDDGGYNEARHMLIVGKNGSGKSVWVQVLLIARVARWPHQMGFLIPDTQGDFADPTKHNAGNFRWNWQEALRACGVDVQVIPIEDVALRSPRVLKGLLKECCVKIYSISAEKAETLAGRVVEGMFDGPVDPQQLNAAAIGHAVVDKIGWVYAKNSRAEKIEDAQNVLDDLGRFRTLERYIQGRILPYFTGRYELGHIVDGVLRRQHKIILAMGGQTDRQNMEVLEELLSTLTRTAQRMYRSQGAETANSIIVLDEAARWIPEQGDSQIKVIVEQAIKETRKAGVGWWIVGQSPADIDKAVLRQAHMKWFGRGLGVGADANHLERDLNKDGFRSYNEMQRQPGRFFWFGVGLDTAIGHDTTHIAITPFNGDSTQAIIDANPHIWTKEPRL